MTFEQAINDISALPLNDQLLIVQAIWDRLADGIGTELSDSRRAELDRRWAEYKADPTTAIGGSAPNQLRNLGSRPSFAFAITGPLSLSGLCIPIL